MKTNSVTYNQADELNKVVRNFLEKKSTFELDSDEQGNLYNLLTVLLYRLEDVHKLCCIDINQFNMYETTYYSFTFESMLTIDSFTKKNQIADAAVEFMNDFTDNDGMFISFNQLDKNHGIFQLNFSIMNEELLNEQAQKLHQAQIQEYPWVSADPKDAKSYIETYGDTDVHLYYDYLIANGIGEIEDEQTEI